MSFFDEHALDHHSSVMPKRKKPQEVPASDSEEEEEQEAPGDSSSSSDDEGSDSFPSGAEDSSGESSDDERGEAFDQVDVDFGFYCPQEKDFQGLRTLLQNYLDGEQWACSEFADAIIQQVCVRFYSLCGQQQQLISAYGEIGASRRAGAHQAPPPPRIPSRARRQRLAA